MISATNNRIGTVMSVVKRGSSKNWYIHFQFNDQTYIRSSRTTSKKIAVQTEIECKAKLYSQQYQGRKSGSPWPMCLSSTNCPGKVSPVMSLAVLYLHR